MAAVETIRKSSAAVDAYAPPPMAAHGLYERHADRIFGLCLKRLRSRQEAEDAVQTTFLRALRALQRGVVPVSEAAWLFRIAQNVCLSSYRSNGRRERELVRDPEVIDGLAAPEADGDALFGLAYALALIPERQRRAIVLRDWHGLSYREIATELELSLASVETLIFRARRSLAHALSGGAGLRQRTPYPAHRIWS